MTKYEREIVNLVECGVDLENYDLVTIIFIKHLFDKRIEVAKQYINTGGIGYGAKMQVLQELIEELGLREEYNQYYYKLNDYAIIKGECVKR